MSAVAFRRALIAAGLCFAAAIGVAGTTISRGQGNVSQLGATGPSLEQEITELYSQQGVATLSSVVVSDCRIRLTEVYNRSCRRPDADKQNVIESDNLFDLREMDLAGSTSFPSEIMAADLVRLHFNKHTDALLSSIDNQAANLLHSTPSGPDTTVRWQRIAAFEQSELDKDGIASRQTLKACFGTLVETVTLSTIIPITPGRGREVLDAIRSYATRNCSN